MKIEKEVKKCDRCGALYEVILDNPDWKVTYLNEPYDLCDVCYDHIAPLLKSITPRSKIKQGLAYADKGAMMPAT